MADAKKTTAETAAEGQKELEAAVTPADEPKRSKGEERAEKRELDRQADVVDAVAKANEDELPKLGGPLDEPGLGR